MNVANSLLSQLHAVIRLHEFGTMHLHIKPEHILLDAAGNAVLSDFGLSAKF